MRRVDKAPAHLTFGVTGSHGRLLYQPPVAVPAVFTGSALFKALEGLTAPSTQRPLRSLSGWRQEAPSEGDVQAEKWAVRRRGALGLPMMALDLGLSWSTRPKFVIEMGFGLAPDGNG